MNTHKNLDVWIKGMDVAEEIYKLTKVFPVDEKFGLISQLRRAAISVPSNIAEGASRSSTKEFIRFLYIARGSISELETQLLLSRRLGYLSKEVKIIHKVEEIGKMLTALTKTLKKRITNYESLITNH